MRSVSLSNRASPPLDDASAKTVSMSKRNSIKKGKGPVEPAVEEAKGHNPKEDAAVGSISHGREEGARHHVREHHEHRVITDISRGEESSLSLPRLRRQREDEKKTWLS